MPLETFNPPVRQSPGTKFDTAFKVKKAEFGDGYTQAVEDGINSVRDTVTLRWDTLLEADAKTIHNWLKGKKGTVPFYYAVDEGDTRKWTCTKVGRGRGETHTVEATFEAYFGLEV